MRNILYIETESKITGPGNSLIRILKRLDRDRFRAVVALPSQGILVDRIQEIGIEVAFIPKRRLRKTLNPFKLADYLAHLPLTVLALARLVREKDIDLVHINSIVNLQEGLATWLMKLPVVWHIHEILPENRINSLIIKIVGKLADRLLAVSKAVKRRLEQEGIPAHKIAVVYNGLDLEEYTDFPVFSRAKARENLGLRAEDLVLGVIGDISERKGQREFLMAGKAALESFPATKLLIIGGTPLESAAYERELRDLAEEERAQGSVIFTGFHPDVQGVIRALDVLVQPSLLDPFPWVVIEGMAAGLPVIGTKSGGMQEQIVEGETGFLVGPGDISGLTEAIIRLARDPELRKSMGAAGRRRVEQHFTAKRMAEGVMQVYEEVLG